MIKKILLVVSVIALFATACKKNEAQNKPYEGVNKVYLETEKDPLVTVGDNGKIKVIVRTAVRLDNDASFRFSIKGKEGASDEWLMVEDESVVIKKGERETSFYVSAGKNVENAPELSEFVLDLPELPMKNMELESTLSLRLLNISVPALTEAQKALIEGYKAKGMDITPFLGKVDVRSSVFIPAGGNIAAFEKEDTKEYEGFSIITLSENATAEMPVLKMVYNAMGINEFFYYMLRKHTVENDENWYGEFAGPLYAEVMNLIKWNKESVEKFSTSLDNIRINSDSGIEYLGTLLDSYDDEYTAVPFTFEFSAWDRLKKLVDEGNEKAIECKEGGATSEPRAYINRYDVVENAINDEELPAIKGSIDFAAKTMSFSFLTSGDLTNYIRVTTEYKAK